MTSWKEGRRKIPSNKSSCSLRTVTARREASFLLLSASMTVEAAAVLPLFLFLMANLLYLTEMVRVQSAAEAALYETAAALAEYAFYLEPETAGAAGGSGPAGPEVLPCTAADAGSRRFRRSPGGAGHTGRIGDRRPERQDPSVSPVFRTHPAQRDGHAGFRSAVFLRGAYLDRLPDRQRADRQ